VSGDLSQLTAGDLSNLALLLRAAAAELELAAARI
jgi:hypothetical protein